MLNFGFSVVFGKWVAGCMCSEVHSSSYLMFCSADRFWHYSQCCGDKFVFLKKLCMYVCVCVRAFTRLLASVDSIKESDRKHFCCLDWSGGPGPHNAMFSLFSLHGLQCLRETILNTKQKYLYIWLYLC